MELERCRKGRPPRSGARRRVALVDDTTTDRSGVHWPTKWWRARVYRMEQICAKVWRQTRNKSEQAYDYIAEKALSFYEQWIASGEAKSLKLQLATSALKYWTDKGFSKESSQTMAAVPLDVDQHSGTVPAAVNSREDTTSDDEGTYNFILRPHNPLANNLAANNVDIHAEDQPTAEIQVTPADKNVTPSVGFETQTQSEGGEQDFSYAYRSGSQNGKTSNSFIIVEDHDPRFNVPTRAKLSLQLQRSKRLRATGLTPAARELPPPQTLSARRIVVSSQILQPPDGIMTRSCKKQADR